MAFVNSAELVLSMQQVSTQKWSSPSHFACRPQKSSHSPAYFFHSPSMHIGKSPRLPAPKVCDNMAYGAILLIKSGVQVRPSTSSNRRSHMVAKASREDAPWSLGSLKAWDPVIERQPCNNSHAGKTIVPMVPKRPAVSAHADTPAYPTISIAHHSTYSYKPIERSY